MMQAKAASGQEAPAEAGAEAGAGGAGAAPYYYLADLVVNDPALPEGDGMDAYVEYLRKPSKKAAPQMRLLRVALAQDKWPKLVAAFQEKCARQSSRAATSFAAKVFVQCVQQPPQSPLVVRPCRSVATMACNNVLFFRILSSLPFCAQATRQGREGREKRGKSGCGQRRLAGDTRHQPRSCGRRTAGVTTGGRVGNAQPAALRNHAGVAAICGKACSPTRSRGGQSSGGSHGRYDSAVRTGGGQRQGQGPRTRL